MNDASMPPAPTNGAGLACPKCGYPRSRVVYTRAANNRLVRRRACLDCGTRVTTWERIIGGVKTTSKSPPE